MPDQLPDGLQDFVDGVLPILQKRGLFRTEYSGRTLREHLGIALPGYPGHRPAPVESTLPHADAARRRVPI